MARAGYAVYGDRLGNTENATANPLAAPQTIDFHWQDANGDQTIQRWEIQFDRGIIGYLNLDPAAPASVVSPIRLDYGMRPATMSEVLVGIQHDLPSRLTLAATATWRVHRNMAWTVFEKTRGSGDYYSSGDYTRIDPATGRPLVVTGTLPDGSPYSVPYYRLAPGVPLPVFKVVTNRPEYEQSYRGVQLLATRRFSDRWMVQGSLAWSDWRQHIGARGVIDPSMLLDRANGCSSCDDAPVVVGGTMLKENVYMNARWSGAVNALYELPWKVTVAANIFAHQGYVIPYYHRLSAEETGDRTGAKDVLTAPIDRHRLDTVHNVDLRVARRFGSANGVGCAIAIEVLNATNAQTVLQRQPNLYSTLTRRNPAANQVLETQSPRIARLSVRFFF